MVTIWRLIRLAKAPISFNDAADEKTSALRLAAEVTEDGLILLGNGINTPLVISLSNYIITKHPQSILVPPLSP
jgi:hypothetical protein